GLVEVSGMPTGPQTIPAAITGDACYYYRARAWQWNSSGKGGSWQEVVDESLFVPFFLEDSTGKVLVNPQNGQLDVHHSFSDEIHPAWLGLDSCMPKNVGNFLALHGLASSEKIRLEEQIIRPGFPLFVFGTLGENHEAPSWSAAPHVTGKTSFE